MSLFGLRPLSRILWHACFASCLFSPGGPVFADTSSPPPAQRMYTPAPAVRAQVQVPNLRQRLLSDAQKVTTDARLRLQVSGDTPADASKFVVVWQTPEPDTTVPAGTTVTVVVQATASRQTPPSSAVIVPGRITTVPELVKHSLYEARPLVETARLKLEVSGGAPEDTSHAIVVNQKPPPGTRVRMGSTVIVWIKTEELVVVPDLVPQILPDAQGRIRDRHLRLEVAGGWPADPTRAMVVEQGRPKARGCL